MPEKPDPEPQKAKADAAPKPSSSFAPSDSSRASAYVPLPSPGGGKGGRLALALAALAAAGVLAGGVAWYRVPAAPPAAAVAAAERKVLWVSDADISAAATERVRRAPPPAAETKPAPAPVPAPAPQGGAPAVENRASSPLPAVPPELRTPPPASAPQSVLTPQGAAAVRSEGYAIFQMRMLDNVDQDGDVVQISVDGVPMSYLSLTHAGATLEIPLKKGETHVITITAVKDGVGGITLGMSTSVGDFMSRRMSVGESETWTVGFK